MNKSSNSYFRLLPLLKEALVYFIAILLSANLSSNHFATRQAFSFLLPSGKYFSCNTYLHDTMFSASHHLLITFFFLRQASMSVNTQIFSKPPHFSSKNFITTPWAWLICSNYIYIEPIFPFTRHLWLRKEHLFLTNSHIGTILCIGLISNLFSFSRHEPNVLFSIIWTHS